MIRKSSARSGTTRSYQRMLPAKPCRSTTTGAPAGPFTSTFSFTSPAATSCADPPVRTTISVKPVPSVDDGFDDAGRQCALHQERGRRIAADGVQRVWTSGLDCADDRLGNLLGTDAVALVAIEVIDDRAVLVREG